MLKALFHWAMVGATGVVAVWCCLVVGEVFRQHVGFFVALWLFLPALALWVSTARLRVTLSPSQLLHARFALTLSVALLSFVWFAHGEYVLDALGNRFVEGYTVTYEDDTDDYGRPYVAHRATAPRLIDRVSLGVFQVVFIAGCVTLPLCTWVVVGRGARARQREIESQTLSDLEDD